MLKNFALKALPVLFLALLASQIVEAQKFKVQTAGNKLKYDQLRQAKDAIDDAYEHKDTEDYYKMWYYRGQIYYEIFNDTSWDRMNKEAIRKAGESFASCIETSERSTITEECKDYLMNSGIGMYNAGIDAFSQKRYKTALKLYSELLNIIPYDDKGTLKRNNISKETVTYNAFITTYNMENFSKSKEYLKKLMDMNYFDPKIYLFMSDIQLKENDTTKALEYLEKGRKKFPDDNDLLKKEIGIYLDQGKIDVLLDRISKAIDNNPNDQQLHFNLGVLYDEKGNFDKAEKSYKKAVSLNESFFDATYNLGALYFNEGVEVTNKLNELPYDAKDKRAKVEAERDTLFNKAVKHLENAREMNPEHVNTLTALKQIYARQDKLDKMKAVRQKIIEIKQERAKEN